MSSTEGLNNSKSISGNSEKRLRFKLFGKKSKQQSEKCDIQNKKNELRRQTKFQQRKSINFVTNNEIPENATSSSGNRRSLHSLPSDNSLYASSKSTISLTSRSLSVTSLPCNTGAKHRRRFRLKFVKNFVGKSKKDFSSEINNVQDKIVVQDILKETEDITTCTSGDLIVHDVEEEKPDESEEELISRIEGIYNNIQKETKNEDECEMKNAVPKIDGGKSNQKENSSDGKPLKLKQNFVYKIIFVGDTGCGKTSIVNRLTHNTFSTEHRTATIGLDCSAKTIPWDDDETITVHLWDTAGQEAMMKLLKAYYKDAHGVFVVFDVTNTNSLKMASEWKNHVDINVEMTNRKTAPCVLLANKCDQLKNGINEVRAEIDNFCEMNKFAAWFDTSAKCNRNIDQALNFLIGQILKGDVQEDSIDGAVENVVLTEENPNTFGHKLTDNRKSRCTC